MKTGDLMCRPCWDNVPAGARDDVEAARRAYLAGGSPADFQAYCSARRAAIAGIPRPTTSKGEPRQMKITTTAGELKRPLDRR